ncbi:MAG: glycosyltransferase [Actinomycetota bacterium]|nr:glycosyltransferase [Actinomycetota bacterium]
MSTLRQASVQPKAAPTAAPWTLLGGTGLVLLGVALLGLPFVVTVLAIAVQLVYVAYFLRHLSFAMSALRSAPADLAAPFMTTSYLPPVTVLVACKNESSVVERLVESLVALDYPEELRQIIVVDDGSTDGMSERLDALAGSMPITAMHRPPDAGGGKSGALNDGFAIAAGEIVVVFDADHRPHADVIRRLVRHFEDPSVGAAQGRCEVSNTGDSPLALLVGIDYLAGYLVNEYGRQAMFNLPAYGGANCAVRAETLRAIGGWNAASVTEDTDLTMRILLSGQLVRFDVTAVDEEEGVTTVSRYWRQRYRWARGHQQVWRDYRRGLWRSPSLTFGQKVEATMFLLAFHLPVLSALGLVLAFTWLGGLATPPFSVDLFVLWMLLFLGPLVELGGGLLIKQADRSWARALFYFLPLFFVSIALCTKAWFDGILGREYSWVKTRRSADTASPLASS